MCRSIRVLRTDQDVAEPEEIRAAAVQFARKITGMRSPSRANAVAFDQAVDDIVTASQSLLVHIGPKNVRNAALT